MKNCKKNSWSENGILPPRDALRDQHFENFLAYVWAKNASPNSMKQAVAYLNFCLRQNGYPNISKQPSLWNKTVNFYKSIQKKPRWRNYVSTKKARSLTVNNVRGLATSPIRTDGTIQIGWLRDKCISNTFIHMGYHPADTFRMKKENIHDDPHNTDFQGFSKPRMKVVNFKTKDKSKVIRNWIACGCEEDHDPMNDNCEYALMRNLLERLPDDRSKISLWWNVSSNEWDNRGKTGMQQKTVAKAMQRINARCQINPAKTFNGDQGRKTLATLGRHIFSHNDRLINDVGNWENAEQIEDYVDPLFENPDRETLLSQHFQALENDRYVPPINDTVPHHLSEIRRMLFDMKREQTEMSTKLVRVIEMLIPLLRLSLVNASRQL